jgi:hypothetical protein
MNSWSGGCLPHVVIGTRFLHDWPHYSPHHCRDCGYCQPGVHHYRSSRVLGWDSRHSMGSRDHFGRTSDRSPSCNRRRVSQPRGAWTPAPYNQAGRQRSLRLPPPPVLSPTGHAPVRLTPDTKGDYGQSPSRMGGWRCRCWNHHPQWGQSGGCTVKGSRRTH